MICDAWQEMVVYDCLFCFDACFPYPFLQEEIVLGLLDSEKEDLDPSLISALV